MILRKNNLINERHKEKRKAEIEANEIINRKRHLILWNHDSHGFDKMPKKFNSASKINAQTRYRIGWMRLKM